MGKYNSYDTILIGAGPAGSSAAAILAEHGHNVLLIEREKFPRYHVGESLIPFTFEPLKRLGASVTGIDASETAIQSARLHSKKSNLEINYLVGTIDSLIEQKKLYDLVIASEVIEHVQDPNDFIKGLKKLVLPKGKIILTTLSRSLKSFLIAKVAAEYLTQTIPVGTHEWKKFLNPQELETLLATDGFRVDFIKGMSYRINSDRFVLTDDLSMNYAVAATYFEPTTI